jgi:hypothetical protein
MARKSQHTFSKRQREIKRVQKAAQKQTRRNARPDLPAPPVEAGPGGGPADDAAAPAA